MKLHEHVVVYREPGIFAGWPANHGLWSTRGGIVVGFETGRMARDEHSLSSFHAIDRSSPIVPMMASTKDGTQWHCWQPRGPLELSDSHSRMTGNYGRTSDQMKPLTTPIDFHDQLVKFRMTGISLGPSYMCVADASGQNGQLPDSWDGPFLLPTFGRAGLSARTSYLRCPEDRHRCIAFWSATKKADNREGQPCCVETTDGGMTWDLLSWIDEPPHHGFGIMPSAVRIDGSILCAVRWRERQSHPKYGTDGAFRSGIVCYQSDDEGSSWRLKSIPVRHLGSAGNPPDMVRLDDGWIVLVYGWRDAPFAIVYQVSGDDGSTWTLPRVIRDGAGNHDIGYTRSAVLDEKIVTVYYWNDDRNAERYIAATVWEL